MVVVEIRGHEASSSGLRRHRLPACTRRIICSVTAVPLVVSRPIRPTGIVAPALAPDSVRGDERLTIGLRLSRRCRVRRASPHVVPDSLRLNQWALSGDWTIEGRASMLNRADGWIAFRFHARDVHLVM
jgi:hypothetical protein